MMEWLKKIDMFYVCLNGYILCAILSFGHSMNNTNWPTSFTAADKVFASVYTSIAWPLYVSVQIFKPSSEE